MCSYHRMSELNSICTGGHSLLRYCLSLAVSLTPATLAPQSCHILFHVAVISRTSCLLVIHCHTSKEYLPKRCTTLCEHIISVRLNKKIPCIWLGSPSNYFQHVEMTLYTLTLTYDLDMRPWHSYTSQHCVCCWVAVMPHTHRSLTYKM